MYRHSLKNDCLAFQLKPPKPPSWRDFVTNNHRILPTPPSGSGVTGGSSGADGGVNSGNPATVGRGDVCGNIGNMEEAANSTGGGGGGGSAGVGGGGCDPHAQSLHCTTCLHLQNSSLVASPQTKHPHHQIRHHHHQHSNHQHHQYHHHHHNQNSHPPHHHHHQQYPQYNDTSHPQSSTTSQPLQTPDLPYFSSTSPHCSAMPSERPRHILQCTSDHSYSNSSSPRRLRRVRAPPRIHRTRSHMVISEKDLPDDTLMLSLAEAKLEELRLGGYSNVQDERIYLEENSRRCWNWLDSIKTCEPLDEIVTSLPALVATNVPAASVDHIDIEDSAITAAKSDDTQLKVTKTGENVDTLSCSATNSSFSHGNASDILAITDSDDSSFIEDIHNDRSRFSDLSSNGENATGFCDTARARKLSSTNKRISSAVKEIRNDTSSHPTALSNTVSDVEKGSNCCGPAADIVKDEKKLVFIAAVDDTSSNRSPSNEKLYKLLTNTPQQNSNNNKTNTEETEVCNTGKTEMFD